MSKRATASRAHATDCASVACSLSYGRTVIDYELVLTGRHSMEIAVHPDQRVVVKAPRTAEMEAIERRMRKRAAWIRRQIVYFRQFEPRTPERKYVAGESHRYLGRQYRLKIQQSGRNGVLLKGGYFFIDCCDEHPERIKSILEAWYGRRAAAYLERVFGDCWSRFDGGKYRRPDLMLRKMKTRWGSLSAKGRLTLNTDLIRTPKECIEYVIIHELCHLVHSDHGSGFYRLLDAKMPDWIRRKHKLEMSLV